MYQTLRRHTIDRDEDRCQYCGELDGRKLEVHPIAAHQETEYIGMGEDLMDNPRNQVTLCKECHPIVLAPLGQKKLLTEAEEEELRRVPGELAELNLRPTYSLPNPVERMLLRRRRSALLERQDQLRTLGGLRLKQRQQEVVDLCERHLQGYPDG